MMRAHALRVFDFVSIFSPRFQRCVRTHSRTSSSLALLGINGDFCDDDEDDDDADGEGEFYGRGGGSEEGEADGDIDSEEEGEEGDANTSALLSLSLLPKAVADVVLAALASGRPKQARAPGG